ncbi:CBS domain-containing protein [Mariniblastus fucicola]|uniref:Putative voltage-gated ClC-type chloride channel ClcB n=1 Tax=Mariniblastus fucicola TaxID=980251 RepID=A0A5B9PIN5_9BACT|nr:CBS domain-containing protein [Mariniblastus fucicola]QEG22483.1 putative voltage-gated ClC-type chloride channel ClcB [Mariniblastus fucicola]
MKTKTKIPSAGDLMNAHVHTVSPELALSELIEFLLKHEISSAPVVETRDGKNILIGFISEQDALKQLTDEMFYQLPEPEQMVRACMKRHPVSITPDVDIFSTASLFVSHGYRHVPVVDEKNQLLGIVSRRDVLKSMKPFQAAAEKAHDMEFFPPNLTEIINHRFIVSN